MGAAGASYGGYMIYWMAGHTNRFKALVAHDGIFNPLSMAGTTEEQWFPHLGVRRARSSRRPRGPRWRSGRRPTTSPTGRPRCWWCTASTTTGWTSRRGCRPSPRSGSAACRRKFLYFPDEGHFVPKPRNRRLWWGTVLDWLDEYLRPGDLMRSLLIRWLINTLALYVAVQVVPGVDYRRRRRPGC